MFELLPWSPWINPRIFHLHVWGSCACSCSCCVLLICGMQLDSFSFVNDVFLKLALRVYHPRFSDPNRSLNHKRKMFKVFEVEMGSNCDDFIINLIIILNIYKNIKLIKKIEKLTKIVQNKYSSIFYNITFIIQIKIIKF